MAEVCLELTSPRRRTLIEGTRSDGMLYSYFLEDQPSFVGRFMPRGGWWVKGPLPADDRGTPLQANAHFGASVERLQQQELTHAHDTAYGSATEPARKPAEPSVSEPAYLICRGHQRTDLQHQVLPESRLRGQRHGGG